MKTRTFAIACVAVAAMAGMLMGMSPNTTCQPAAGSVSCAIGQSDTGEACISVGGQCQGNGTYCDGTATITSYVCKPVSAGNGCPGGTDKACGFAYTLPCRTNPTTNACEADRDAQKNYGTGAPVACKVQVDCTP